MLLRRRESIVDDLPTLFELRAGSFYIQLASGKDRGKVLEIIKEHAKRAGFPADSDKEVRALIDPSFAAKN